MKHLMTLNGYIFPQIGADYHIRIGTYPRERIISLLPLG